MAAKDSQLNASHNFRQHLEHDRNTDQCRPNATPAVGILIFCVTLFVCFLPVLWCCCLGGRKGIRPVKHWVVRCCRGYLSGARCRLAYGHSLSLALVKSRLVLPLCYRLTQVVPDKGPLNVCVCVLFVCCSEVATTTNRLAAGGETEEKRSAGRRGKSSLEGCQSHWCVAFKKMRQS